MNRKTLLTTLSCGLLVLSACSDETKPTVAEARYETCTGARGTCGGSDCCGAQTHEVLLGLDDLAECTIRRGPGDSYIADFSIRQRSSDGSGISGSDLEFQSTAIDYRFVRACDEFAFQEAGNEFTSNICDRLDVESDAIGGNGCEIELYLDESSILRGKFQCKELQLPGNPNFVLSTLDDSSHAGLGTGVLAIRDCRLQL